MKTNFIIEKTSEFTPDKIWEDYCFQNGSSLEDLIVINQFTFWDRALVAYSDQLICDIFEENEQD